VGHPAKNERVSNPLDYAGATQTARLQESFLTKLDSGASKV